MYERIKKYLEDPTVWLSLCFILVLVVGGLWLRSSGGAERSPAYNQARKQLADVEGQRQRVEAGLTESQQTINSVTERIRDSQQTINRAEARYSSAGDILAECEQITKELRRRAEERAASK